MGWFTQYGVNTKEDLIEHIKSSSSGKYVAHKSVKEGVWILGKSNDGSATFIILYLVNKEDNELWYKIIDESSGPLSYDCPLSFIKQSTSSDQYSKDFHKNVIEYWKSKTLKKMQFQENAMFTYGNQRYRLAFKAGRTRWAVRMIDGDGKENPKPYWVSTSQLNQAVFD